MTKSLQDVLGPFGEQDYSVRLCRALFGAVPGGPPFVFYNALPAAVARVAPGAGADAVARAQALVDGEDARRALWIADALDTADAGLAAVAGAANLFSLFSGARRRRTFESDTEQAVDAGLKLLGLSYMVSRLFPGELRQKLETLNALPAGREAVTYAAVAEIALPFADNLVEGGANLVSRLVGHSSGGGAQRLASFAGADAVREAQSVLGGLSGSVQHVLGSLGGGLGRIGDSVRGALPSALGIADSLTGAVATGVDALPVWRFLGGRLAAEACALRATSG
jgi:hypothetical protein